MNKTELIKELNQQIEDYYKLHAKIDIVIDEQIFYYDTDKKKVDFYNRLDYRAFNMNDLYHKFKVNYISFRNAEGTHKEKTLKALEKIESEYSKQLIVGINTEKEIIFIKRFDNSFIKFYIDTLVDDILERTICGVGGGSRVFDVTQSRTYLFLQKFNIFDQRLDNNHFVFLRPNDNEELLNHLKELKSEKEIQYNHDLGLVVFKDSHDYHFFSLIYKPYVLFNATFKDFREKIIDGLIFNNFEKSLMKSIVKKYLNSDYKFDIKK